MANKWYVKTGLIDELQSVLNTLEVQYCKIHTVSVFILNGEVMYVIVAQETIETQIIEAQINDSNIGG